MTKHGKTYILFLKTKGSSLMANISTTNLTINWLPDMSKANSNSQLNAINQIKASIITLGLLGDDGYGLSTDIWIELLDSFKKSYNNPEQINDEVYTSGEGRWSFNASVNGSTITSLIDTLSYPVLSNILDPFTYVSTDSLTKNIQQPFVDKKFIESFYSFLPSASVSLLKNQDTSIRQKIMIVASLKYNISNATELLYNAGVLNNNDDDEISLLNISYNDYEPGVDFLEIGGEFTLIYDTITKTLSYNQVDGEVIDNPSNDILYDHNFSDISSEEIVTEYLDMLNLKETVKNLNLTDIVVEEIRENFTIATYMTYDLDENIEEFTNITSHVMGIINNAIDDLESKQHIGKIINELDEIPPYDEYALNSKINSFLEVIA